MQKNLHFNTKTVYLIMKILFKILPIFFPFIKLNMFAMLLQFFQERTRYEKNLRLPVIFGSYVKELLRTVITRRQDTRTGFVSVRTRINYVPIHITDFSIVYTDPRHFVFICIVINYGSVSIRTTAGRRFTTTVLILLPAIDKQENDRDYPRRSIVYWCCRYDHFRFRYL